MQTIKSLINSMKREPEPRVHFHNGPSGQPMVCHEQHCVVPRLDV